MRKKTIERRKNMDIDKKRSTYGRREKNSEGSDTQKPTLADIFMDDDNDNDGGSGGDDDDDDDDSKTGILNMFR